MAKARLQLPFALARSMPGSGLVAHGRRGSWFLAQIGKRAGIYGVLGLATAIFVSAAILSLVQVERQNQSRSESESSTEWNIAQAVVSAEHFMTLLERYIRSGDVKKDDLDNAFDVIWSRFDPLLPDNPENGNALASMSSLAPAVDKLKARMDKLYPVRDALLPGDMEGYAELRRFVEDLQSWLHGLSEQAHFERVTAHTELDRMRSGYQWPLFFFLLTALSIALVVGQLVRAIRRMEQRELMLAEVRDRLARQASEMQELAQVAERASGAKSDFLAAMSHEIRTPMTSVLGMADLLAAERLDPAVRRYVEVIRTSGRHLLGIINDILDFSRIEAGRLELERIDFSLADTVGQVRVLLAAQAAERGLELSLQLEDSVPAVLCGDPTRLKQVLVNLVGNGIKFTSEGEVRVTARQLPAIGGEVLLRFEVRDTGIGIPADRQEDLFRAFTQADTSTTRRYGGSGLGLVICKRLVEAMGGVIGVESEPGAGSLFWFEVPFAAGDPDAVASHAVVDLANMRPLRILVAEDVPLNRDLLGAMLGRHGHEVTFAENGALAVELAMKGEMDVILMDVQMPVMDGLEATRRIRLLPPPVSEVPILALTANVMASEREQYLAAGMNMCLTKPVVWGDLFAALSGVNQRAAPSAQLAPAIAAEPTRDPPMTGEVPLIDRDVLDGLAAGLSAEEVRELLGRVVVDAGQSCRRLEEMALAPEQLAREAHRLRGTAASFGLAGIAGLAARIEQRAKAGEGAADLTGPMRQLMEATVLELRRLHLRA